MLMSSGLMPHAVCWRQDQHLIWTMVVANAITFLSYVSLCFILFYLARKTRRSIARDWSFFLVGFALFIVACGSTHLMEVVTTWDPVFWIDAWANIITAALSGYVAIQFIRRAPELGFGINDYADKLANAVTEKAQVEDNLLAARKLEEWNRMSSVVTHEINNPLGAVQNLLFLIQGSPDIHAGNCSDGPDGSGRGAADRHDYALDVRFLSPGSEAGERGSANIGGVGAVPAPPLAAPARRGTGD